MLQYSEDGPIRAIGLGKGKPFCAKKKLGFSSMTGRGKAIGGFQKRQRVTDFGRKRAPKAKMRGIFGVPGLGLQVRDNIWPSCNNVRHCFTVSVYL